MMKRGKSLPHVGHVQNLTTALIYRLEFEQECDLDASNHVACT